MSTLIVITPCLAVPYLASIFQNWNDQALKKFPFLSTQESHWPPQCCRDCQYPTMCNPLIWIGTGFHVLDLRRRKWSWNENASQGFIQSLGIHNAVAVPHMKPCASLIRTNIEPSSPPTLLERACVWGYNQGHTHLPNGLYWMPHCKPVSLLCIVSISAIPVSLLCIVSISAIPVSLLCIVSISAIPVSLLCIVPKYCMLSDLHQYRAWGGGGGHHHWPLADGQSPWPPS